MCFYFDAITTVERYVPMDIVTKGKIEHVTIRPGEYHVSSKHVVISTLLGSCIAACLYDPVKKVLGMNHFLLSSKRYAKDMPLCITDAGRYGINAMELVINEMLKLGAKRENLHAKAFGGSTLLPSTNRSDKFICVGEVNCRFIVEFLKNDGIPLIWVETRECLSVFHPTIIPCSDEESQNPESRTCNKMKNNFG